MAECIFCKIIAKDIPARIVFEDERVFAFEDINPKAPVHILLIPKVHLPSLAEATAGHEELLGYLLIKARDIAKDRGLDAGGYRVVINTGRNAGQEVFHLHVHLLGGRPMTWPPG